MKDGSYLSTSQAADRCGVAAKTVARWVDAGVLPAVFTTGGHRRIRESDLDRFLDERRSLRASDRVETGLRVALLTADKQMRDVVLTTARRYPGELTVQQASDPFKAGLVVGQMHPHLIMVDAALVGRNFTRICKLLKDTDAARRSLVAALVDITDPAPPPPDEGGPHLVIGKPLSFYFVMQAFDKAHQMRSGPTES